MRKKAKNTGRKSRCQPSAEVSEAGRVLRTKGKSWAGSVLASKGKREKSRRLSRGCLDGSTEDLSSRQKKHLPTKLKNLLVKFKNSKGKSWQQSR